MIRNIAARDLRHNDVMVDANGDLTVSLPAISYEVTGIGTGTYVVEFGVDGEEGFFDTWTLNENDRVDLRV